jgi:hypothetical protein
MPDRPPGRVVGKIEPVAPWATPIMLRLYAELRRVQALARKAKRDREERERAAK